MTQHQLETSSTAGAGVVPESAWAALRTEMERVMIAWLESVEVPGSRPLGGSVNISSLCAERGWSRARLISQMRKEACARGVILPGEESLLRMVRQWASGSRRPSPEYQELLRSSFGLTEREALVRQGMGANDE